MLSALPPWQLCHRPSSATPQIFPLPVVSSPYRCSLPILSPPSLLSGLLPLFSPTALSSLSLHPNTCSSLHIKLPPFSPVLSPSIHLYGSPCPPLPSLRLPNRSSSPPLQTPSPALPSPPPHACIHHLAPQYQVALTHLSMPTCRVLICRFETEWFLRRFFLALFYCFILVLDFLNLFLLCIVFLFSGRKALRTGHVPFYLFFVICKLLLDIIYWFLHL